MLHVIISIKFILYHPSLFAGIPVQMSTMSEAQPKARSSWYLLIGGIFAFLASLILFISFCSPYWLESYPETYSEFVRMGLWNFCFKNYRHPSYQYDELFDGCHWVFSYKYQNIRDWMQPG